MSGAVNMHFGSSIEEKVSDLEGCHVAKNLAWLLRWLRVLASTKKIQSGGERSPTP